MMNSVVSNSFFDLVSVYLKVFVHLTWNFYYFWGMQQALNSDFLKVQDFVNFELSPLIIYLCIYITITDQLVRVLKMYSRRILMAFLNI